MTSPRLQLLERKFARQNPEQAPAPVGHGLGAAIEKLIADEVERRVSEAMERKAPARVRDLFNAPAPYTDFKQIPPTPTTAAKTPFNVTLHRDGAGLIAWSETSDGRKFKLIRDGAGKAIRMEEVTESPVLPPLAAPLEYKERKIYSNNPEVE